jgi:transcriptional regulator with XRE-family HTH domain
MGGDNMDGEKVRIQRVIRKISQQELAERAKVDRTYISQIETGKKEPSIAVLSRIAKALGCNVKDFF